MKKGIYNIANKSTWKYLIWRIWDENYESLSIILNDTYDILEKEEAIECDKVAPSTQHGENQHREVSHMICESLKTFDPERWLYQKQVDNRAQLQLSSVTFEE